MAEADFMMVRHARLESSGRSYRMVDLPGTGGSDLDRLPWTHRILLENLLRFGADPIALAALPIWLRTGTADIEIPFSPARIMMHDTTCGPALVDIAACRSALAEAGRAPDELSPMLPVDVSTDHSVAVDDYGTSAAKLWNLAREFDRNGERYRFMKWATRSLGNVRVHPPGSGIMHTINMERLATVVAIASVDGEDWAIPDTLIGTDSHTPMVNGMGVLGWGVGGLEAEGVMFGMPVRLRVPEVIGVRLTGRLRAGVLATDLALAITERLRQLDLTDRFVEFYGPGVSTLSVGERAVVANMAPEYGATTGYFPIDDNTLAYLAATGRPAAEVALVADYAKRQGLWFDAGAQPTYARVVDFDLNAVRMSLAGPHRPQDRLAPAQVASVLDRPSKESPLPSAPVAIAAITSCTNTTDPRLLIAAGLLARKARALGLASKPWVKTSLAPGSPAAERYLRRSGLLDDLEALGFAITGFGCTVCIGNSGSLPDAISDELRAGRIRPVAVLSGNRNFPGRVHPQIDSAFLASPPLVVAFALAGDAALDIAADVITTSSTGCPVRLGDIWPSDSEIDRTIADAVRADDFAAAYDEAEASPEWRALEASESAVFPWDPNSTYLRRPPFASPSAPERLGIYVAHPLIVLGDDITTDHISPAGAIPRSSEAARYLLERGADPDDLNVYSARRGNWEVMVRGLFTNRSVRNLLGDQLSPGETIHAPSGEILPLFEAAERYRAAGGSVVIVAGERYGMGSSRDWAAKGPALLGVRAVLASGFERIHRQNLINMGILPLRLPADLHPATLQLQPGDVIIVEATPGHLEPRMEIPVVIRRLNGEILPFSARAAVETELEVLVLRAGGILPMILKQKMAASENAGHGSGPACPTSSKRVASDTPL